MRIARLPSWVLLVLLCPGAGSCGDPDEKAGDRAWSLNHFNEARLAYRKALDRSPANQALATKLAQAEEAWSQDLVEGPAPAEAGELEELIALSSGRGGEWKDRRRKARLRVASVHVRKKRWAAAIEQYAAMAKEFPDCAACADKAARVVAGLPGGEAMVKAVRSLLAAWPKSFALSESAARWLADHGIKDAAIRLYEGLLASPEIPGDLAANVRIQVALKLLRGEAGTTQDEEQTAK